MKVKLHEQYLHLAAHLADAAFEVKNGDLDAAQTLGVLSNLFAEQGDLERALRYSLRTMEVREQQLGVDHPTTGISAQNLGTLYSDLGEFDKAHEMYERAKSICEQHLGPHHEATATAYSSLALR